MSTETATPICDLIESLLSRDLSRGTLLAALAAARPVEGAMIRVATTASMAVVDRRQYERERKANYRERVKAKLSQNVPDKPSYSYIPLVPKTQISVEKKQESKKEAKTDLSGTNGTKRGCMLPEQWCPDDVDFGYGERLGLTVRQVNGCAEDMRLWAKANANRAIGRKADWRATFHGWLRREAPKLTRQNGGSHGKTTTSANSKGGGFAGFAAKYRDDELPLRPAPEDLRPINGH